MESKCLGLLIGVLACGCSSSIELGVLGSGGGAGAPAKGGAPSTGGKPAQSMGNAPASGGAMSVPNEVEGEAGEPATSGGSAPVGGSPPLSTTPEDDGSDCDVPELPSSGELTDVIEKLPDPFTRLDGTVISEKADWRCRRAEIREQAEVYAFGEKAPAPDVVTGTVTGTSITVNLENGSLTGSFTAKVKLPSSGSAPYPAIIVYGGAFPVESSVLSQEGVATIEINPTTLGEERGGASPRAGLFYDLNPGSEKTGYLLAWAWGVSRVIDVIEQSAAGVIDSRAIGVTGCSRYGKGAFLAGAFDQRIALTLPFEPGTAGVAAWRGVERGELGENDQPSQSLATAYAEQPWFGDAIEPFLAPGAIEKNPIDTHELVAMVAPRGLLVFDNPEFGELSPHYSHLAVLAGAEVYGALGVGDHVGYLSDLPSHIHCGVQAEYTGPLRAAIKKFLRKNGTVGLTIAAKAGLQADLEQWRDWTTPTLE